MSSVVVDTDVVSFVFKNHPIGTLYDADLAGNNLVISFMTLAELDRWAIQAKWSPPRRNWLRLYLDPFVVLPYTRDLCTKWVRGDRRSADKGTSHRVRGCLDCRYCPALRPPTGHS